MQVEKNVGPMPPLSHIEIQSGQILSDVMSFKDIPVDSFCTRICKCPRDKDLSYIGNRCEKVKERFFYSFVDRYQPSCKLLKPDDTESRWGKTWVIVTKDFKAKHTYEVTLCYPMDPYGYCSLS